MEELQACNMQFLAISAILVLGILGLVLGRKIITKAPGFSKVLRMLTVRQPPVTINLHREVSELRRTTLQIAQDWVEMTTLMTTMKDLQLSFIRRLDSDFETMSNFLQNSVKVTLDEECIRNDQRFNRMQKMLEDFRDEFLGIKDMLRDQGQLMKMNKVEKVDGWSQTEKETILKKKPKETMGKGGVSTDSEGAKSIISLIKKALAEFLKEVMKHLAFQREEGMANMRVIFTQLSEDKEDIKCTIESAFSTATHQTQKSFEQFGLVGREAVKCMQAINEKSENCLAARFQEFGDKLVGVFDLLKGLNFDVSSIKQILDNIDGQFDEIYQKLELSCQKNSDHCEEVTDKLQKTAEEWNEKSYNLEQISKQLGNATEGIKDMLCNLGNLISCKTAESTGLNKGSSDLSLFEESLMANKNILELEQFSGPEGFGALAGMIQICFEKLTTLQDQIERGTTGIQQSAHNLVEKLDFLTNLVENSVESLKVLSIQEADGNPNPQHKTLNQDLKEFVSNIININLKVDEEKPTSRDFPKLLGITKEDTEPALKRRYLNGFQFKGADSDKTSIVTVAPDEKPEILK